LMEITEMNKDNGRPRPRKLDILGRPGYYYGRAKRAGKLFVRAGQRLPAQFYEALYASHVLVKRMEVHQ
jgi:hypothetical protein